MAASRGGAFSQQRLATGWVSFGPGLPSGFGQSARSMFISSYPRRAMGGSRTSLADPPKGHPSPRPPSATVVVHIAGTTPDVDADDARALGAMEGNNAHLIADRMKGKGRSWSRRGARHMAKVRELVLNQEHRPFCCQLNHRLSPRTPHHHQLSRGDAASVTPPPGVVSMCLSFTALKTNRTGPAPSPRPHLYRPCSFPASPCIPQRRRNTPPPAALWR